MSVLSKLFGDANEKIISRLEKRVEEINALEEKVKGFSDLDFKNKTEEFKKKLADKSFLEQQKIFEEILIECFALVREAGKRTLGQRHYDVQLIAAMVLHQGNITEMKTGEGKTLAATAAVYLNALTGRGVHVITVNDYLARRDAVWMGQIYDYLGLTVGCLNHESAFLYNSTAKNFQFPILNQVQDRFSNFSPYGGSPAGRQKNSKFQIPNSEQNDQSVSDESDQERDKVGGYKVVEDYLLPVPRKLAYEADITYGTNNEYGFDYLRDNMVQDLNQKVQIRGLTRKLNGSRTDAEENHLHFAIIDEVDSILIDEARTPLIISAPDAEPTEKYHQFAELVSRLKENDDYNIDEKMKAATLTEDGIAKMEKFLGVENIYTERGVREVHHIEQALRARVLFKKDRDYVIQNGEIIIVDEFTGRLMLGRRYSEGLHQAIEAKENVQVKQESITMATITFQNYFRMYQKLAGMTGTAATEGEEFAKIYNLEVVIIPTNKPMVRLDKPDAIFKNTTGKYQTLVKEIKRRHELGQPILVGTISIENNEYLAELLQREGVPHEVLNAKNHEREAEIIAQAGRLGAVTIATNMAGRGVDIILGGNPATTEEQNKVKDLGGLCVLGTERHEARRIDNQLRGRAGRQGDPGESQFFVSMEDDLMRIFGGERMKSLMQTLGLPDETAIENKMISNSIEKAQMKVEGHNFDIRKHLVEYDDVINKHREVIYRRRSEILNFGFVKDDSSRSSAEFNAEKRGNSKATILNYLHEEIEKVIDFHTISETGGEWNYQEIIEVLKTIFVLTDEEDNNIKNIKEISELKEFIFNLAEQKYAELENKISSDENFKKQVGEKMEPMCLIEQAVLLRSIDLLWVEHIDAMDHMRTGIGLVGYGQKDPLVEYKNQARRMFQELLDNIRKQVVYTIFKVSISPATTQRQVLGNQNEASPVVKSDNKKVGRNDPCPCGSGKKFKKCHGA